MVICLNNGGVRRGDLGKYKEGILLPKRNSSRDIKFSVCTTAKQWREVSLKLEQDIRKDNILKVERREDLCEEGGLRQH